MAVTIHVGLTRKMGMPNYGSIAASCAVDFEADAGLLQGDLKGFHQHIGKAYAACHEAVQQELARQQGTETVTNGQSNGQNLAQTPGQLGPAFCATAQNGNGHPISEKQMSYLRQLAKQVEGLGIRRLETLTQKMYGKPLAALTSFDASGLIDTIKSIKAGQVDLAAVLNGVPK